MSDKISVLVVEDESFFREEIEYRLSDENILRAYTTSVSQAMGAMEAGFIPDVAIVDLHIPILSGADDKIYHMDGYELSREIVEKSEGRTRVIVTSMVNLKNIEAEPSKAWGYFGKTGNWDLLKDAVKMGKLKDNEVGKVIVDIQSEFGKNTIERRFG